MMSTFTVRVYGIVIEKGKILLSEERIQGNNVVKFPGGGLQYGEGTRSCLSRELLEETGCKAIIGEHFYTTDFFQPSAFHHSKVQVLSIYYFARLLQPSIAEPEAGVRQIWLPISELNPAKVDLPIDKVVVEQLLKRHR